MENTIMECNSRYIVKSGHVTSGPIKEPVKELENTLNELSEIGFTPINITQHFLPGMGWIYSLVAKR